MQTCPECGSVKANEARRCSCGFPFARGPIGVAVYRVGLTVSAVSRGLAERLLEPIVPQRTPLNAALFDLFFVSTHPIRRHLGNLSARKALRVFLVVAAIAACFWLGFSFLR